MENNTDLKQPEHQKQDALYDEAASQLISPRSMRKTVLITASIGVAITVLLFVVMTNQDIESNSSGYLTDLSELSSDGNVSVITGLMPEISAESFNQEISQTDQTQEALHLKLDSCIGRVNQGFEALQVDQLTMRKELPAIGEGIRMIQDAIADLRLGNELLSQRITEIQTKLKTIAKDVRGLKTPKKRITAKKRKPVIKTPPFQIDAIDLWNDVIYVAVSHNGRVAFLKEGEQQSGWSVTRIDRFKGKVQFRGPAGQIHLGTVRR